MNNLLTPYLFFNGNCREALTFYKKALGGEVFLMTYGETQGEGCPAGTKEQIIHGALKREGLFLMASDTPTDPVEAGDNVQLALGCESLGQIETFFKALGEGGKVGMPLHDAFWGDRFGTLTDRFGINWMFTFEQKKK